MRPTRLLAMLFLVGCTCGEPPVLGPATTEAPSTTNSAEPPPAEPTPTEPAPERTARVAQRPDAAVVREVRRLVREARVTEHGGEHAAALALFDQALRLVPGQPRVLCEAGFVAHRAGRTALAAERIDTALRVFNAIDGVDAEDSALRVPHAMCLYNRGLVATAQSDWDVAVETYTQSLALRENATVRSALARASSAASSEPEDDDEGVGHLAGFILDMDGENTVLQATEITALESALESAYRGFDDFGGGRQGADSTNVHVISTLTVASRPEVVFLSVDSADYPLSTERMVIAVRTAAGFMLFETTTGGADQTDHGAFGGWSLQDLEASWSGDVLSVVLSTAGSSGYMEELEAPNGAGEDVRCYSSMEERSEGSTLLVCQTIPTWSCYEVTRSRHELGSTTERTCEDDSGARADLTEVETVAASPPAEADYQVNPNGITVTAIRGDLSLPLAVGTHGWDDLAGHRLGLALLTDEELAEEAASAAEDDDAMDEDSY